MANKYYDENLDRWRDEKGRFTTPPETKEKPKPELEEITDLRSEKEKTIDRNKWELVDTPTGISSEVDRPTFFQDESGKWKSHNDVVINGEEYNAGEYIPQDKAEKYKEFNQAKHNKGTVQLRADKENVQYSKMLENWYMMKKAYRGISKYNDIYFDGTNFKDRETDEIIDPSMEMKELADLGLLDYDVDSRYEIYQDYKEKSTGSP